MSDSPEKASKPQLKDGLVSGQQLAAMVGAASELLDAHRHIVNDLNVFPVPDGDTGTNMSLTLKAVAGAAIDMENAQFSADAIAQSMARHALMEARGNSGVILSQFFRGFSEGFAGVARFGTPDLARALDAANSRSYSAVAEPTEGTMLTIIAVAADAARSSASRNLSVRSTFEAINKRVEKAVVDTENMLDVLTEAGVVDAGGFGIQLILRGMTLYLLGESVTGVSVKVPGSAVIDSKIALKKEFLDRADHSGFGFCTQLLISTIETEGIGMKMEDLRTKLDEMASSVVVVGDHNLLKIHVHTLEPNVLVDFANTLGQIVDKNIQDMDEQEAAFSAQHRSVNRPVGRVSLIAVAGGIGLSALFTDLGACEVVSGGRTSNPSVKEIAESIGRAPAASVIVLPNDSNVVPAAEQAARMVNDPGKTVIVVPTESVQQGVAAALTLNIENDLETNRKEMMSAFAAVKSAEVTIAVRSTILNGVDVEAGHFVGLLDGLLVVSDQTLSTVTTTLLESAGVGIDQLVTIFKGELVAEGEAEAEVVRLSSQFPDAEFELVDGGQPHYHYLLSIE